MGAGTKIALVALLVLVVVVAAKIVSNGVTDEGGASVKPAAEAPRQVIVRFGPDELWGEETIASLTRQGLEITGMTGIVHDGNTVGFIVSVKKMGAK